MKTLQFGYHLTLDLYGCPIQPLESLELIYKTLDHLVAILDMKALCPPHLIKAQSNELDGGKDPGGITGYLIIAESHISIHTFSKRGFVSMDLYSCKEFDYDKAEEYIKDIFKPKDIEIHKLDRGLSYPSENLY